MAIWWKIEFGTNLGRWCIEQKGSIARNKNKLNKINFTGYYDKLFFSKLSMYVYTPNNLRNTAN